MPPFRSVLSLYNTYISPLILKMPLQQIHLNLIYYLGIYHLNNQSLHDYRKLSLPHYQPHHLGVDLSRSVLFCWTFPALGPSRTLPSTPMLLEWDIEGSPFRTSMFSLGILISSDCSHFSDHPQYLFHPSLPASSLYYLSPC